jgi:hypothetical protein
LLYWKGFVNSVPPAGQNGDSLFFDRHEHLNREGDGERFMLAQYYYRLESLLFPLVVPILLG